MLYQRTFNDQPRFEKDFSRMLGQPEHHGQMDQVLCNTILPIFRPTLNYLARTDLRNV